MSRQSTPKRKAGGSIPILIWILLAIWKLPAAVLLGVIFLGLVFARMLIRAGQPTAARRTRQSRH